MDETEAYALDVRRDGRERAGRRRGRGHARLPREARAFVARSLTRSPPSVRCRHGLPVDRRVPAPAVRAAVDGRVRVEHRHVDGDDRDRRLRDRGDRPGRVDRRRRGRRLRPHRPARSARRCVRRPVPAPAADDDDDARADRVGDAAHGALHRRRAVGTGRHGDRLRQRHRRGARVPGLPGDAPRPRPRGGSRERDRDVVGAVQPRARHRPGDRRRRDQPRWLRVGVGDQRRQLPRRRVRAHDHPDPAADAAARRRDALALDGGRCPFRARAIAACASASARCASTRCSRRRSSRSSRRWPRRCSTRARAGRRSW